eukprot:CAMPEP_0172578644 /NCGR_PEP_ID=MMETSP1067-20121228/138841_1 /TAXON_ID=265564 ORGANISM="Thalassiosira punctigera, Strain Tpunct2005C2" /NCGR_SAMPLE_ID=MMETSP1067 /ASSEMBLY_ACC=CAM_ASM_000444 /LENGTH=550 /DNA_ID=CAMNT_0013371343 /DNA_START=15 /DNA_END=1664 /DNA_ORIENTATION=-
MVGGAGVTATTIIHSVGRENHPQPAHSSSRLRNLYHNKKCMPLLEWTFVAGIPTLLCIKIVRLPPTLWSKLLPVESAVDGATIYTCESIEGGYSLQWVLPALVVTSVLSLIAIMFFGDSDCPANFYTNSRGTGIVVGSHLIPLLYLAMQPFVLCGDKMESDNNFCASQETRQPKFDSCFVAVEEEDYDTQKPLTGRRLNHLDYASLGGLAFIISYIWSQYNHRKHNCKRWSSLVGVDQTGDTTNRVNNSKDSQSEHSSTMSICWKIYLLFMLIQHIMRAVSSEYYVCTLLLGTLHLLLILSYDQKTDTSQDDQTIQGAWQDAFTPGEWMAVSTLITSLVGEYLLEYAGMASNTETLAFYSLLPLHLIVSHAGLVGCLVSVTLCSCLKKSLPKSVLYQSSDVSRSNATKLEMTTSLISVAGMTFVCLEIALHSVLDDSGALNAEEYGFNLLPLSLQWLFHFLSSKFTTKTDGNDTGGLRVEVLGYWVFILALSFPVVLMLSSWVTDGEESNTGDVDTTNVNRASDDITNFHNRKERKKRVIIARKLFHLVA